MNTQEYLGQIRRLNLMIENTSMDIMRFKALAESITVPMDKERVQTSGTSDIVGDNVTAYVTLQQRGDVKAWVQARNQIIAQISSLSDSESYDILYKKYVLDKDMPTIAESFGCTTGQAYKILRKATAKFELKYRETYHELI